MLGYILLFISTLIWGFGFIATKWSAPYFSGGMIHALRYFIAAIVCLPYIIYVKGYRLTKAQIKMAILLAFFLGLALYIQTIGVVLTTIAKGGFLTTIYAFFTPLLMMIFQKKRFHFSYWILIFAALFGIYLLCDANFDTFTFGDFLVLLCAFVFSIHILLVEKYAPEFESPLLLNCYQIIGIAVLSSIIPLTETKAIELEFLWRFDLLGVWGILFLSILSSVFAFSCQISAQKKIPAHIVSLIFLLESPFAAIFGYFFYDEILNTMQIFGCVLIIVSVYLVSYFQNKFK